MFTTADLSCCCRCCYHMHTPPLAHFSSCSCHASRACSSPSPCCSRRARILNNTVVKTRTHNAQRTIRDAHDAQATNRSTCSATPTSRPACRLASFSSYRRLISQSSPLASLLLFHTPLYIWQSITLAMLVNGDPSSPLSSLFLIPVSHRAAG